MTVLVTYAGAHAATAGIAQQIADRLLKSGLSAVAHPASGVESLRPYHAVVLGSAGHPQGWLPEASAFLNRFAGELDKLPVWSFSTCSVGETRGAPVPELVARALPAHALVGDAANRIRFRDHRHFAGEFAPGSSHPFADLFFKVCGGSPADHRDFREVNEWTSGIARELQGIEHVKERRRLHLSVRGKP